jgi:hypothetical protein
MPTPPFVQPELSLIGNVLDSVAPEERWQVRATVLADSPLWRPV